MHAPPHTTPHTMLLRLHQQRAAAIELALLMLRLNSVQQKQEYFKSINQETTR